MAKIIKLASILMIFCAISAGMLAYVFVFAQPKIELNSKLAFDNSLKEVLSNAVVFKEIKVGGNKAYEGQVDSRKFGLACAVSPYGYGGAIDMLVGIDSTGKVVGLKILNHKETPGLGSNITNQSFQQQFMNKTIADKLEPKKDIDAITGATISSRAVCKGVRSALEIFSDYRKGKQ